MSWRSSATSTAAAAVARTTSGNPIGSPNATSSSTVRTSGVSWPIRASITSVSVGASSNRPVHRHTPYDELMSPLDRAEITSSRSSSALPWESCQSRSTDAESTGPPRTWLSRSAVSLLVSGPSSTRSTRSSVHSARIGSGTGSPVRTVARIVACSVRAT